MGSTFYPIFRRGKVLGNAEWKILNRLVTPVGRVQAVSAFALRRGVAAPSPETIDQSVYADCSTHVCASPPAPPAVSSSCFHAAHIPLIFVVAHGPFVAFSLASFSSCRWWSLCQTYCSSPVAAICLLFLPSLSSLFVAHVARLLVLLYCFFRFAHARRPSCT